MAIVTHFSSSYITLQRWHVCRCHLKRSMSFLEIVTMLQFFFFVIPFYAFTDVPTSDDYLFCALQMHSLLCPRLGGIMRWSASGVRLSVRLSDVVYIGSNSKTKRPRKTKLCTGVPQVTCDSRTDFKVKRSKVKVTGRRHIVAAT